MPDLILCEITGKEVPADETIVLDGKRVCAEGKAILLERMKNGKNGEVPLSPGWAMRIMAMALDYAVAAIVFYFLMALVLSFGLGSLGFACTMAGVCAYYALMHGMIGQTLGKMACGLKVVRDDDRLKPVGFGRAFGRAALYVGPPVLLLLLAEFAVPLLDLPYPMGMALSGLPLLYLFLSGLFALIDPQQRAIHDRLTGTRVVRIWALEHLASKTAQAKQLRKLRAIALEEIMAERTAEEAPPSGPDE